MSKRETGIQREIKDALEACGYVVRRVHSGKVKVKRGWMQLAEEGTPDLIVMGHKFMAWLEVKSGEGEVNEAQSEFMESCLKMRVPWIVARSASEAVMCVRREFGASR